MLGRSFLIFYCKLGYINKFIFYKFGVAKNYLNSIWAPLEKLNLKTQFDIVAIVKGGGLTGQTDAIKLGVARLICKMEHENRLVLKPFGFLSRDARIKERKKYGLRKARKASQYSKR